MKDLKKLMTEITQLTTNIETNYPELYKFLDESPVTLPVKGQKNIDTEVLSNYLEALKTLLKHHIEEHKHKVNA